jgi:hypothetical protein
MDNYTPTVTAMTEYWVVVTDNNSCSVTSDKAKITVSSPGEIGVICAGNTGGAIGVTACTGNNGGAIGVTTCTGNTGGAISVTTCTGNNGGAIGVTACIGNTGGKIGI